MKVKSAIFVRCKGSVYAAYSKFTTHRHYEYSCRRSEISRSEQEFKGRGLCAIIYIF